MTTVKKLNLVVLDLETFLGSERFMRVTQAGASFGKGLRIYLDADYARAIEEFRLALIAAYIEGEDPVGPGTPPGIAPAGAPLQTVAVTPRDRAIIYLYTGNSLAFQGEWTAALQEYLNAIQTDPSLTEAHYNIGVSFAAQGQIERAVSAFQETLRYNPYLYEANFALARCYQAMDNFGTAYVYFTTARECRPDAAEPLYHLGLMHQAHGAQDLAQQCFTEALRVEPSFQIEEGEHAEARSEQEAIDWYFRLGEDLKAQDHSQEAERVYRALLQWQPQLSRARYLLANLLARQKLWREALPEYRQIPPGAPEYVPACIRIGNIFRLLRKPQIAYQILYQCARSNPHSSEIFLEMGKILATIGRLVPALRCLQRAIQLDGRSGQAFYFLGRLYMALNNVSKALASWRKALSLSPKLISLRYDMGIICLKRGRYREAITEFEAVVRRWPDDLEAHYLLGLAFKESGDPVQAIPYFEHVVRNNPQHAQALYYLGACHLQIGNSATGMRYLQHYDRLLQGAASAAAR